MTNGVLRRTIQQTICPADHLKPPHRCYWNLSCYARRRSFPYEVLHMGLGLENLPKMESIDGKRMCEIKQVWTLE